MTQLYEIWNPFEQWPKVTRQVVACNECAALYLQPMYGCKVKEFSSRFECQIHESQGQLKKKQLKQLALFS